MALGVKHVPFANTIGIAVGWCACGEVELLFVGVGDGPTVGAELFFRVDEIDRTGRLVFDFRLLVFRLLTVSSVVGWLFCWPFVAATGTAREGDTCDDCAYRQEASTGRPVRHTFCEDKLCKNEFCEDKLCKNEGSITC